MAQLPSPISLALVLIQTSSAFASKGIAGINVKENSAISNDDILFLDEILITIQL